MVKKGKVLGHLICDRGVQVDIFKIDVIMSLAYSSSLRDVRSFIGHICFYRRFIEYFGEITLSLSNKCLLLKDAFLFLMILC